MYIPYVFTPFCPRYIHINRATKTPLPLFLLGLLPVERNPDRTIASSSGLVKDSNGMKMSKTKGNVVDPIDTMDKFGTDALRYTLVTGVTPGQDVPLSMERVQTNM